MRLEAFKSVASATLAEYPKEKTYGWSHWRPEKEWDSNTVIFSLCAFLWEESEDYLIANMCIDKDLSEEEAKAEIRKWLDEKLPKYKS